MSNYKLWREHRFAIFDFEIPKKIKHHESNIQNLNRLS